MRRLLKDLYNLFFPQICYCCEVPLVENEDLICIKCSYDLPVAEMSNIENNEVERVLKGRVAIAFGTTLFFYERKGIVQKLIHLLKYKGHENLGGLFGKWLGEELSTCHRLPRIDYVVPVPVHKEKLKERGYNQVTQFALSIAMCINAEINQNQLLSSLATETQTLKLRSDRWKTVKEKFYLKDTKFFEGKSVLLVDDVITTGATLEACCHVLQKTKAIRISIATIAFTS